MSVSTRRIQPVHGAFGAPSHFFSSSSMEASWNRIPNVCAPRVRLYEGPSPPIAPTSRTAFAMGASSSGSAGAGTRVGVPLSVSASGNRPRRTSVTYGSPTPTRRAPPPPPVPAERTASALRSSIVPAPVVSLPPVVPKLEDPFADAESDDAFTPLTPPPPVRSSCITSRTRVTVSTYTVPSSGGSSSSGFTTPPGLGHSRIPSTRDTRGRLVASVLLSRTGGRPLGAYLRRRLSGEQQGYVKSGLSQLVAAAA